MRTTTMLMIIGVFAFFMLVLDSAPSGDSFDTDNDNVRYEERQLIDGYEQATRQKRTTHNKDCVLSCIRQGGSREDCSQQCDISLLKYIWLNYF